jgi:hypothetical protein
MAAAPSASITMSHHDRHGTRSARSLPVKTSRNVLVWLPAVVSFALGCGDLLGIHAPLDADGATDSEAPDGSVSLDNVDGGPTRGGNGNMGADGEIDRAPLNGSSTGGAVTGNETHNGSSGGATGSDSGDAYVEGAPDGSADGNMGDASSGSSGGASSSGAGSSGSTSSSSSSSGSSGSGSGSSSSSSGGSSSSSSSGGTPPPQCPGGDGLFCGGDAVTGDANTLFCCYLGSKTPAQPPCQGGCQVRGPINGKPINDRCVVQSCPSTNGPYCGGDGVPGCPNTLYQCVNGDLTNPTVCANGCQVAPPGVDDYCR